MAHALRGARETFAAEGAAWVRRERDECVHVAEDAVAPLWKGWRFPLRAAPAGWVILNEQTLAIEDVSQDARVPADFYAPTFVRSLALAPLRRESVIGALGVFWREPRRISPEELQLLQALGDVAAAAYAAVEARQDVERLQRARVEATESANRELETFSFNLSHDLRAPIRAIDAYAELLLDPRTAATEARGYLNRIRNSAQQMNRLIDDTLKLARVSSASLTRTTVDLSAVAAEIAISLRTRDPRRDLRISVAPELKASGDPDLLRIALEQLMENAWKFTARATVAEIEVGCSRASGRTEFFVRDNGVGFDAAAAPQLFEPFQRFHPASEFKGNGIGLAAVRRIVARHGGRLRAESTPGRGATFYFELP